MCNSQFAFTKDLRLLTADQYNNIFKNKPIRKKTKFFLIVIKKNNFDHCRLGLIVSKKELKKAVERNKVKRVIRESFRVNSKNLKGLDIVALFKPNIEFNLKLQTGNTSKKPKPNHKNKIKRIEKVDKNEIKLDLEYFWTMLAKKHPQFIKL